MNERISFFSLSSPLFSLTSRSSQQVNQAIEQYIRSRTDKNRYPLMLHERVSEVQHWNVVFSSQDTLSSLSSAQEAFQSQDTRMYGPDTPATLERGTSTDLIVTYKRVTGGRERRQHVFDSFLLSPSLILSLSHNLPHSLCLLHESVIVSQSQISSVLPSLLH